MVRRFSSGMLLGLTGCWLAACGSSPPTRYFALAEVVPREPVTTAIEGAPLRVESITLPAELDRLELVRHEGANRVRIAGSDRWAAPLDEQIRAVLSEDLAARLPSGSVANPGEPVTQDPRRLLSIEFVQFEVGESCAVTLQADWTLTQPQGMSARGHEQVQTPARGQCDGQEAAALSTALGSLADRIASQVRRM